jgi:hypothetical protein
MAHTYVQPTKVVDTSLALLTRSVVIPSLVWRDAAIDTVSNVKDKTITIRLPAYAEASVRALYSTGARQETELHERGVDIRLDKDIYLSVPVLQEQMGLDITDFAAQVLAPANDAVSRKIEEIVAEQITSTATQNTLSVTDDNWLGWIAQARTLLNLARVPNANRTLLIGATWDQELIQLEPLRNYSQSDTTDTLRLATIGNLYGFRVVTSDLIDPGTAYAFHKTAYALASRTPPPLPGFEDQGASAVGPTIAMRTVFSPEPKKAAFNMLVDSWIGTAAVKDKGTIDADNRFIPATDPTAPGVGDYLVRSVKLEIQQTPPTP